VLLNIAKTFRGKTKKVAETLRQEGRRSNRAPGDGADPNPGFQILDESVASLNRTDRAIFLLYLDDVS
jgi:hypothetical protein